MTLIEKAFVLADYYLPQRGIRQTILARIPYGFAMLSLLMAIIAALHGFSIHGLALGGSIAMKFGAVLRNRVLYRSECSKNS